MPIVPGSLHVFAARVSFSGGPVFRFVLHRFVRTHDRGCARQSTGGSGLFRQIHGTASVDRPYRTVNPDVKWQKVHQNGSLARCAFPARYTPSGRLGGRWIFIQPYTSYSNKDPRASASRDPRRGFKSFSRNDRHREGIVNVD